MTWVSQYRLAALCRWEKRYILAPGVKGRADSALRKDADIKPGNALSCNIPVGTMVHNIEMTPGGGGKLVRSAGAAAQLMARERSYATLRMPSGK